MKLEELTFKNKKRTKAVRSTVRQQNLSLICRLAGIQVGTPWWPQFRMSLVNAYISGCVQGITTLMASLYVSEVQQHGAASLETVRLLRK